MKKSIGIGLFAIVFLLAMIAGYAVAQDESVLNAEEPSVSTVAAALDPQRPGILDLGDLEPRNDSSQSGVQI